MERYTQYFSQESAPKQSVQPKKNPQVDQSSQQTSAIIKARTFAIVGDRQDWRFEMLPLNFTDSNNSFRIVKYFYPDENGIYAEERVHVNTVSTCLHK